MERRSEMKRRFNESNDFSALEKVDALEKSMEAFRKEMNSKLEFIQEILRAKNAQIEAQKRILDYESTVFKTLVENWDTNSQLSKLGFSHLIRGLGDDIGRVLTPNNDVIVDEDDYSETDLTYDPSGDEMDTNCQSSMTSRTRRSRRTRKSRATTDDKSKTEEQSESTLPSKKQRIMIKDDDSRPRAQNWIIKDENVETIVGDDDDFIVPDEQALVDLPRYNSDDSNLESEASMKSRNSKYIYQEIAQFTSFDEAKDRVKQDHMWSQKGKLITSAGTRIYYSCKVNAKCPSRIYLLCETGSQNVTLYRTEEEHDHEERVIGLPDNLRAEIKKLYELGTIKPKAIIRKLNALGFSVPKKNQLNNYLAKLRASKGKIN